MDPRVIKILSEILSHLDNSQGGDLKSMMDQEKAETPVQEAAESPDKEALEAKLGLDDNGAPKPDVMGKPKSPFDQAPPTVGAEGGDDQEMSDDELEELIKKLSA